MPIDRDTTIPASADYPQGFAMNLTHGVLRCFPTAKRFAKGHRIRPDVQPSNFPLFDVNPQTGEDPVRT
tara:strand:- start:180 stop:386 length:207 start_codon:yes stop_codon:yes gene_type:complete